MEEPGVGWLDRWFQVAVDGRVWSQMVRWMEVPTGGGWRLKSKESDGQMDGRSKWRQQWQRKSVESDGPMDGGSKRQRKRKESRGQKDEEPRGQGRHSYVDSSWNDLGPESYYNNDICGCNGSVGEFACSCLNQQYNMKRTHLIVAIHPGGVC
jgi:hypothetical protein